MDHNLEVVETFFITELFVDLVNIVTALLALLSKQFARLAIDLLLRCASLLILKISHVLMHLLIFDDSSPSLVPVLR